MIVDCHAHWGNPWTERDGENPVNWLGLLDRHNVDKAILLGYDNLMRCDKAREDNDRIARVAAHAPDRLYPFGTVWPQTGAESIREARHCIDDLGMKGLKFHPWVQGFSTANSYFQEVCGMAGEAGVPVMFHDGTPCYSLPEQIAGLARRFPRTTFVLGHSGIIWAWRNALEAMRQPNVWLCLCGPHQRAIEILCEEGDPDRLLWGSDIVGFGDPIEYRLNLVLRARVQEGVRQRLLGANPLRLLGIEA